MRYCVIALGLIAVVLSACGEMDDAKRERISRLGQSMTNFGGGIYAASQPRYPTTTNCYRMGNMIQCQSY